MKNDLNQSKVPFISKLAYGMGDVGCNFSWMFVGNFLMIFYTDVFGISMSAVATLMLFSRFWDAINDPIIGGLSDKTHTRWGRYRPWLLFAAPLTALVLILTFWAHPDWSQTHKIIYMAVTYCILVLGYTCVNIPYGTLCGAMTQNMTERAQINTSRSVSAMIAIGIINIITIPLIEWLGNGNARQGYLLIAILYGTIFAVCHIFCFAKTKEVVEVPVAQKIPLRLQLQAVAKNKPYLLALLGQVLFGFILYGRNADLLYYFTYVENDAVLFTYYSMAIIIPSIIGAACFPKVFQLTSNKGWAASVFAFGTGITIIALFFFSPVTSPIPFYLFAALSQFFFSGFNTAIYAIIPDCVEYGEWRTGIRNDGFQYAFISLGNKIGMALGTALLALSLGWAGYEANTTQNEAVVAIMRHSFSTIPGILWVVTALALFFYKLDKRSYNRILAVIKYRFLKRKKNQREYDVIALGELLVDFNALHSNDFDSVVYESNPGGAPCNVLAMLSNLQKRTAFIGKVGDDFLGHALQQRIVRMGISTEGLSKDKKRNTTLAFLNDSKTYPHQYLFYRSAKDDGVARPLITFGEYDDQCHYLPRCIEKIIDVGIRTIDISTIVEIMLRLGLPDEKMHQVTAKYVKDLIVLTREINHLNHNNESMRREMETIVQTVDEGIITLDACDNVLVFNAAAEKIFNLSSSDIVGRKISSLPGRLIEFLSYADIAQLVREGSFREDLYYRLNVLPLHLLPLR